MKTRYPISFLFLVSLAWQLQAATPVDEMADAAKNWLAALTPEQKTKATYEFKNDERLNWHFIPRERKGLPVKEMTSAQRNLAHALLSTGMSQRGYAKAVSIMSLEAVLKELEGTSARFDRNPELYFFTVFGTPGSKGPWGWRTEGHHFAINFTIVNGELVTGAPNFMGTNPAEVKSGPRQGLRVLGSEEDLGRKLVTSLNESQKALCIYTNVAHKDIITVADRKARLLQPLGIGYDKLNKKQQEDLMVLIREYLERTRPEISAVDLRKIKDAGLGKLSFAWAGGLEKGQGHYYRVQGPTFLLEYDNTQNDNNHIHAVWRDLAGDFGEDLLKKHYSESPH